MATKKKYCVVVSRMTPHSRRLFERGQAPKPIWKDLGTRCFRSKTEAIRYARRVTRFRPGRSRIEADIPTIARKEWDR